MPGSGPFCSEHQLTPSDDLIIAVQSACPLRYSLSVERAGSRDDDAIKAANEKVTERCYDLLNRTRNKKSDDFSLMYRLAGVCDFRRGPIPHVPMLLLPRDPRFVVFDAGLFFLRGYVEQDRIADFKESMEPKEMETLLQGISAMADATEHLAGLTRPEIREMLPSSATEETLDALVDRLQPQDTGLESEISNAMQGICFDRARLLRGLWPDEPDPDSPEDWLKMIGVGTADSPSLPTPASFSEPRPQPGTGFRTEDPGYGVMQHSRYVHTPPQVKQSKPWLRIFSTIRMCSTPGSLASLPLLDDEEVSRTEP